MTKEKLKELKDNQAIKFIYKMPSSLFEEGVEYLIIGNVKTHREENIKFYSLKEWFKKMSSGSILSYVCATLPKNGRIKELLNIYQKPDLLKLRKYILQLRNKKDIIQESLWGIQIIQEYRVNRPDIFKVKYSPEEARQEFLKVVDPIYKMSLSKNNE